MRIAEAVERRLNVAERLANGGCGGGYYEATLLASSLLSGLASDIWCGRQIDGKRFVELWVRYADPMVFPIRISVPLLFQNLEHRARREEARTLLAALPSACSPGESHLIVAGEEVDVDESGVVAICPRLTYKEIRAFSYPKVFYEHVRSTLVHEYNLGDTASGFPMLTQSITTRQVDVSYQNRGDSRRIHFHFPWLADLVRSIAGRAEQAIEQAIRSGPINPPRSWWIDG